MKNYFSEQLLNILDEGALIANALNQKYVTPRHLLLAMKKQDGCLVSEFLKDIPNKKIKKIGSKNIPHRELSASARRSLLKGISLAYMYEHRYVGSEHLLAGILQINEPETNKFLEYSNIDRMKLEKKTLHVLKNAAQLSEFGEALQKARIQKEDKKSTNTYLEQFASNLTTKKVQKQIDPCIAREKEIERIIEIFSRRRKNAPILLGPAGVGKTAIVEGLAKRILQGDVPEYMMNKTVYSLDLASLMAGSMYRGELENRLKNILKEIEENKEIILFIDEIHNMLGVGGQDGAMDMANILKPALARGTIRCIGTTTHADYRKYFEKDAALSRRFQPIFVDEPNRDQTFEILKGSKQSYENFHGISISDDLIYDAIDLAHTHIPDKRFPDKAFDVLDEAGAGMRSKKRNTARNKLYGELNRELRSILKEKQSAVLDEQYGKAKIIEKKEKSIIRKLEKIQSSIKSPFHDKKKTLLKTDIHRAISKICQIDEKHLLHNEGEKLLKLEKILGKKIYGQDAALASLANTLRRAKAGLSHPERPIASFLFYGPSGTGKTYTSQLLAEYLFANKNSYIKIDMSEYAEKFTLSKLIGSPAGYVGYQESGVLTSAVKENPNSVVVLDEIDKSHPDIANVLLQILEQGYLLDSSGSQINFRNCIIIITANSNNNESSITGFSREQSIQNTNNDAVLKTLKPELLNRIDKVIAFQQLGKKELLPIVKQEIKKLQEKLSRNSNTLKTSSKLLLHLAKNSKQDGAARSIQSQVHTQLEEALIPYLLSNDARGIDFLADIKNGEIVIQKQKNNGNRKSQSS